MHSYNYLINTDVLLSKNRNIIHWTVLQNLFFTYLIFFEYISFSHITDPCLHRPNFIVVDDMGSIMDWSFTLLSSSNGNYE